MENQNSNSGKRSQCLSSDIISSLPENITEKILTLMPIRDALRTSVLSKKWRYTWQSMPELVFTEDMVEEPNGLGTELLKKYKLVIAIFHVLLFHNGPAILHFQFSVGKLQMVSEFNQIISHLSKGNTVKELYFTSKDLSYRLPNSFFSLQGLEQILLVNCEFEPPLTFTGFSRLSTMAFGYVPVSAKMLQRFISKCPLLDHVILKGRCKEDFDFAGGNKFTFVELLQHLPSIKFLDISKYYMENLAAGDMPHKLPTSLLHFEVLCLEVCFMEQNEISSALYLIRSSPLLKEIGFLMCDNEKLPVRQTPTNFLEPENHSDLKLDHLEILEIIKFSNLPLEMEFVELIMAKAPVLKEVRIELSDNVSVYEEVKMLRDMVILPSLRASPSARLIIER